MSRIIRAISESGGIVVYAVDSTDIVSAMERIHRTSATASAALGRLLTASSLMGSMLKGEKESITVRINGGGAVGNLTAVSDSHGNVKGYCDHPSADLSVRKSDGKLDVSGIVGRNGNLYVVKDLGLREPYVGQVPLVSGEIAEDITSYFATSQQTPTACALGVLVDRDLTIKKAGGYILQLLPGALDEEIAAVENNVRAAGAITSRLDEGMEAKAIIEMLLSGFSPEILDEREAEYRCGCSRERTERALISLGKKELTELEEEDDHIEVVCNFCLKKYQFSAAEILGHID